MKSIPIELTSASRVGTSKQVRMRVDSKLEISSEDFGKLDELIGNVGLLIIGDDIIEPPKDSEVREQMKNVVIDKPIEKRSRARQFRDNIWYAQVQLNDGEKPSDDQNELVYGKVMDYLINKTKDNPEWIKGFMK